MLRKVQIHTQYKNAKYLMQEGPLKTGLSILVFVADKGQNKGQRSVKSVPIVYY